MKKFSVILLVAILLLGTLCYAENDDYSNGYDAGYDEGYNAGKASAKAKNPIVKVIQPEDIPEVNPGDVVEFKITFKNTTKDSALNLHLTPEIEGNDVLVYERPLEFATTVTLRQNDERSTIFKIKTNENAKNGTYALKLKFEYKNVIGELFQREDVAYFKIVNAKTKPILSFENLKVSEKELKYGDTFNVTFDLKNIGGSEAKEVELNLEGFSDNGIMPIDSKDYNYISKIDINKSTTQAFAFKISEDILTKDNTIKATVTYKGFDDKEYSASKNIYITNIKLKEKESGEKKEEEKKEEDPKLAKPKMIISNYNISPNSIIAGDDFVFTFTFKNTSREKDIRNIKVTLSSHEGCFNITNGSNTFYIEKLGKVQSVSKSIELKAKQDLASNSYAVNIAFDYEDFDGGEYSSTESINIPVTEFSKLVINSANVMEGYVGTPTSLSFDYVNMGKATISNLTATVTGDFEPMQEMTYIGNIQAGNSDYYDIEVKPTKVGVNYGTLVLTFEDSSGRNIEVTRDFQANAYEEAQFGPEDEPQYNPGEEPIMPEEEGITFRTWQIVLAGIGSFLVSFILVRAITKKIMLKKFEDEI